MSARDQRLPFREQMANLLVWVTAAEDLAAFVESTLPALSRFETWLVRDRARLKLLVSLCQQLQKVAITGGVLEAVAIEARVACRILLGDLEYIETAGEHRHQDPQELATFRSEQLRKRNAWDAFMASRQAGGVQS